MGHQTDKDTFLCGLNYIHKDRIYMWQDIKMAKKETK